MFHKVVFYGTACDEAILMYVPENMDDIIQAHMWIGGGCYLSHVELTLYTVFISGFPVLPCSMFPNAIASSFLSITLSYQSIIHYYVPLSQDMVND